MMEWAQLVGYLLGLIDGKKSPQELADLGKNLRQVVAAYPDAYDWPLPSEHWSDTEFTCLDFWRGYKMSSLLGDCLSLGQCFKRKPTPHQG